MVSAKRIIFFFIVPIPSIKSKKADLYFPVYDGQHLRNMRNDKALNKEEKYLFRYNIDVHRKSLGWSRIRPEHSLECPLCQHSTEAVNHHLFQWQVLLFTLWKYQMYRILFMVHRKSWKKLTDTIAWHWTDRLELWNCCIRNNRPEFKCSANHITFGYTSVFRLL